MIIVALIGIFIIIKLVEMMAFGEEDEARRTLDDMLEEERKERKKRKESREVSKRNG